MVLLSFQCPHYLRLSTPRSLWGDHMGSPYGSRATAWDRPYGSRATAWERPYGSRATAWGLLLAYAALSRCDTRALILPFLSYF